MWLALLVACTGPEPAKSTDSAPPEPSFIPWSGGLPSTATLPTPRGLTDRRAIVHLHSPWSHDACDGAGWEDGVLDEDCLSDLRAGLCATRVDVAFLTDHPDHLSAQSWDDVLLARGDDTPGPASNTITCDDGHVVTWLPGVEDELMPLALDRHVHDDPDERHRLLNDTGEEGLAASIAAGGTVFVAHTEGRDPADLETLQDAGLTGVELFNLHAMFAPDIRPEAFGLEPFDWIEQIAPFTDPDDTGEPDLLFLAVLQEQAPSIATWDRLLARGPAVGVAGTDAHQNVLPLELRDGERGDSYRRMLRWFANHILVRDGETAEQALAAGRAYTAFEALGTPWGFDVHLGDVELGGTGAPGPLTVTCPTLHPESPRGPVGPEISVIVYRDGVAWQSGCGTFDAGPGVYRVRVDQVPLHLEPFLGSDPDPWLRSFPWVYSNAIRVE